MAPEPRPVKGKGVHKVEGATQDARPAAQAPAGPGQRRDPRGRQARRLQMLGGRPYRLPPRCASCDGYSLHAGVSIGARDRKGLERLCGYIARPPLAKRRLESRKDGTVEIRLKQPWADGTGAIQLSRLELKERLAALVPPPRQNQALYHRVLALRAAWREEIVPQHNLRSDHEHAQAIIRPGCASRRSRWMLWSTLLEKVLEVDRFEYPTCDQPMHLQAVVLPPATLRVPDGHRAGMPGAAAAGGCLKSRGCQALGRSGRLRLGADLELFGACFRSKPSGLCCRSRP
jgi:hypothetical protein